MSKVKYYYSAAAQIRRIPVVTNDAGEVLYIYDKMEALVKRIPRVTVASVYDKKENTLSFGVAVCSPKDTFKKSIGREIALKRATESPKKVITGFKRSKVSELSRSFSRSLISEALTEYIGLDL